MRLPEHGGLPSCLFQSTRDQLSSPNIPPPPPTSAAVLASPLRLLPCSVAVPLAGPRLNEVPHLDRPGQKQGGSRWRGPPAIQVPPLMQPSRTMSWGPPMSGESVALVCRHREGQSNRQQGARGAQEAMLKQARGKGQSGKASWRKGHSSAGTKWQAPRAETF